MSRVGPPQDPRTAVEHKHKSKRVASWLSMSSVADQQATWSSCNATHRLCNWLKHEQACGCPARDSSPQVLHLLREVPCPACSQKQQPAATGQNGGKHGGWPHNSHPQSLQGSKALSHPHCGAAATASWGQQPFLGVSFKGSERRMLMTCSLGGWTTGLFL